MDEHKILPHKVTKPIQLLAAWLVGLTVIDGAFLGAAIVLDAGDWTRIALIVAAIINVPLFLVALFLLQTKFRPELQEDTFYYQYLNKKTNRVVKVSTSELYDARFSEIQKDFELLSKQFSLLYQSAKSITLFEAPKPDWSLWRVSLNDHLDSFAEIRKALREAKVPLWSIYGKINGSDPPTRKIITFNNRMGVEYVISLLKTLLPFKFDGFKIADLSQEFEEDDVLIGAYGYESGYIAITDEFEEILEGPVEKADIDYYIKTHSLKKS